MGMIYVVMTVKGKSGQSLKSRFLVDSWAIYSLLSQDIWRALSIKPQTEMEFTLADGTLIRRQISECQFVYKGVSRHSPVILGEKGDPALLGAVTLETMGLVLDPFKRTLQPMQMVLAGTKGDTP